MSVSGTYFVAMTTQTAIMDDRFVAYRVQVELTRQKKSQRWLARALDEKPNWMNRRMRAEVPFTVTEIARVADVLDVEVTVFFPPVPSERAS